jgi:hypothetical protein
MLKKIKNYFNNIKNKIINFFYKNEEKIENFILLKPITNPDLSVTFIFKIFNKNLSFLIFSKEYKEFLENIKDFCFKKRIYIICTIECTNKLNERLHFSLKNKSVENKVQLNTYFFLLEKTLSEKLMYYEILSLNSISFRIYIK